jgi:hypothetical protein
VVGEFCKQKERDILSVYLFKYLNKKKERRERYATNGMREIAGRPTNKKTNQGGRLGLVWFGLQKDRLQSNEQTKP